MSLYIRDNELEIFLLSGFSCYSILRLIYASFTHGIDGYVDTLEPSLARIIKLRDIQQRIHLRIVVVCLSKLVSNEPQFLLCFQIPPKICPSGPWRFSVLVGISHQLSQFAHKKSKFSVFSGVLFILLKLLPTLLDTVPTREIALFGP